MSERSPKHFASLRAGRYPQKADNTVPVMLTLAGSDPSGGAGIQADLKTAAAFGVYGASVITALTAQNTTGVIDIHTPPLDFLRTQYTAVVTDLDIRAVKIGMLGSAELIAMVAELLDEFPVPAVVLDPVMVATSGDRLVSGDAAEAIRELIVPQATVVTPNAPEATELTGVDVRDERSMIAAGAAIVDRGAGAALVKGGHLTGIEAVDVLVTTTGHRRLASPRVDTPNTHGTGCTLSSAIAAGLTRGTPLAEAVEDAKDYLTRALRSGATQRLGAGSGPVDHSVLGPSTARSAPSAH